LCSEAILRILVANEATLGKKMGLGDQFPNLELELGLKEPALLPAFAGKPGP
jgi:hypothetical protein